MTVAGALEDVTTIGAAEQAEVVDVDTVVADGFFGFDTTTAFHYCFLAFDEDCSLFNCFIFFYFWKAFVTLVSRSVASCAYPLRVTATFMTFFFRIACSTSTARYIHDHSRFLFKETDFFESNIDFALEKL